MKANNFTLIAHRGYSSKAPENTLASFWLAITSGFPQIELDIELTKDEIAVVFHDEVLNRTTNSTGKISEHNLNEIASLDDGAWFSNDFANTKIPTLRHVLKEVASQSHLHIELKSKEEVLPQIVASELDSAGLLHETKNAFAVPGLTVTSFILSQLERSIKLIPDVHHSWLVDKINDHVINAAKELGIGQLCPKAASVTKDDVNKAKMHGFSVRGWGVENVGEVVSLFEAGADGATVNWPDKAKQALNAHVASHI